MLDNLRYSKIKFGNKIIFYLIEDIYLAWDKYSYF